MTDAAGGWTKGPCKASRARKSSNFGNWTAFVQCETGTIAKVMGGPVDDRTVAETNAALIAEAFNVATETGLSPRQLAEQRDELLTAAVCVLGHMTGNMDGNMDLGDPVEMLRCAIDKAALDRTKEGAL